MITENLKEALKYVYSICFAEIENGTSCSCFHTEPFNEHWDKKTVIEVKESVQRYLKTWVLPKLMKDAGKEGKIFHKKQLIKYHKIQIEKLKSELSDTN
jgi:hypothetical protein